MQDTIKNYEIKIEVLGPLHIGNGKKISKAEYVYDKTDKKFYIMDTFKMFKGLARLGLLEQFEKFVFEGSNNKKQKEVDLSYFLRTNNVKKEDYKSWASYSYMANSDADNKNYILECIKDPYNMVYVPGSSLKGAIRNAILNAVLLKNDKFEAIARSVETAEFKNRNYYLLQEAELLNTKIFHRMRKCEDPNLKIENVVNDIFRAFRVSDSKPISTENIVLCKKVDVFGDGSRNELKNILRESIKPNTIIEASLEIDESVFKMSLESIENAIKIMYNNTKRNFLSKFPNVHNEKGVLLYIGGGSGFVSKTAIYSLYHDEKRALKNASEILDKVCPKDNMGNHKIDQYEYGVSPRVRKCTLYNNKLYDFGLCRIEFKPIG